MSGLRVTSQMTTTLVAKHLGMKVSQLLRCVERGALPPPSFIDNNGVRYSDQEWSERKGDALMHSYTSLLRPFWHRYRQL